MIKDPYIYSKVRPVPWTKGSLLKQPKQTDLTAQANEPRSHRVSWKHSFGTLSLHGKRQRSHTESEAFCAEAWSRLTHKCSSRY